jgi:hypothetical protein
MLISEAMVMLAPYGVERIDLISSPYGAQTWKVRQNGVDYIYACRLQSVVRALTAANDWEG